ncbi:MAG: chemotaxis protein CheB [Balneolaceae bacterium]|nr:chemotaxis protein CheB [Balneolaceae bacterium]
MKKINLYIIDSDEIVRQRVMDAIANDPEISIAESESLGDIKATLENLNSENPDALILGINEKNSDEMELFIEIRAACPYLPVMVMTPHNREGAEVALHTLKKGAVEYFPKTSTLSNSILPVEYFEKRVKPVIKVVPRLNRAVLLSANQFEDSINKIEPIPGEFFSGSFSRMEMVVIAGCLGGVASLYLLLAGLPGNLPVPVIVVQHAPDILTDVLADDLDKITELNVVEAKDGDALLPGQVYISPGDHHVTVRRSNHEMIISLNQNRMVQGFRPSIDVLMKSVRKQYGNRVLSVFLSGGGNDGIDGANIIDVIGGQIIIQNKQTSLLSDLTWKLEMMGLNEGSYPIERLAHEISRRLI